VSALLKQLAKVRVTGLPDADHDQLATLGGTPSPLGRALRALMACVAKREELLERRMLAEQANLWAYIAALEDAGGRVPGTQGDRYRREQWRAFYGLVTAGAGEQKREGEVGMTGFSMWEPSASKKIAEHFAKAAKVGALTSEFQAPGALRRVELPHPAPLTPEEAVAFIAEQNGQQTPRGAWDMLNRIGTENLPPRPRTASVAQEN
jgi:hypothetical protein